MMVTHNIIFTRNFFFRQGSEVTATHNIIFVSNFLAGVKLW